MSKDRELSRGIDVTVLGLATILHDESKSVEELSIRLDRLRFRRIMGPPMLLIAAVTIGSLFGYMIVRATEAALDLALEIALVSVTMLIASLILLCQ